MKKQTTETKKIGTCVHTPKVITDPRFKVIPKLSLTGKDIMSRLKNRSLVLDGMTGNYTLEEQWSALHKMSKADIARERIKNGQNITNLKQQLNK